MSRARNGWKQRIRRLWKWIDGRARARKRIGGEGGENAKREGVEEKGSDHEREERTRGRREGRKWGESEIEKEWESA
jgi:hypothetical protein